MPIVLYRVDERLIHGQVVVGWGGPLHADRIVVVDDEIVASAWEQELYCLGVPTEIEASFASIEGAIGSLEKWRADPHRTILLMGGVRALSRLADGGHLEGTHVVLGGIHHAPDRQRVLPYLYLSPDERRELDRVAARGVRVSAQDLPSARDIPLDQLRLDD
jgi:mannose/fructose/N-acetylgalactosamine-specific phosphotransferase system component IIB